MKNAFLPLVLSTGILLQTQCSKVSQNVSNQVHIVQIQDVGVLQSVENLQTYLQAHDRALGLRLEELSVQLHRYKMLVGETFWEKDFKEIFLLLDQIDARQMSLNTKQIRDMLTKDLKS